MLEPRHVGVGRVAPTWTLIYLHSFSNKAADYTHFPHYFGVSGAALRVVLLGCVGGSALYRAPL